MKTNKMNPYSDFPSNIEGIVKRRLRKSRYARRNEKARKYFGIAVVVGVIIVYLFTV